MLQGCNNIVISWLYRTCWNNLATSLIMSSNLLQVVNCSLFQTCWQLGTSSANTTCWRLVDVQTCYKMWDFYACTCRTRVKISHLVASLATNRQVVFALLVPSCQQVWNKLLTTCNNLLDIIRLVARLFTTLCRQPCNILVISWLYQTLVRTTL
jgi:hypothetical protein